MKLVCCRRMLCLFRSHTPVYGTNSAHNILYFSLLLKIHWYFFTFNQIYQACTKCLVEPSFTFFFCTIVINSVYHIFNCLETLHWPAPSDIYNVFHYVMRNRFFGYF